jgi:hypothetical protein
MKASQLIPVIFAIAAGPAFEFDNERMLEGDAGLLSMNLKF